MMKSTVVRFCSVALQLIQNDKRYSFYQYCYCHDVNKTALFLVDPYAWGDNYPSCHPLLESHHSPINLDHQLMKNQSLDSLHLEGFNLTHKDQWWLTNQGHSSKWILSFRILDTFIPSVFILLKCLLGFKSCSSTGSNLNRVSVCSCAGGG